MNACNEEHLHNFYLIFHSVCDLTHDGAIYETLQSYSYCKLEIPKRYLEDINLHSIFMIRVLLFICLRWVIFTGLIFPHYLSIDSEIQNC